MIFMRTPPNFNKTFFSSRILACKYALDTSNVAISLSWYASIDNVVNSASSNTVGDAIISTWLKYIFCVLTFVQVFPFMIPSIFFFIRFTASNAFYLSERDSISGFIAAMNYFTGISPSSIFFNLLTISTTDISPNSLKFRCLHLCKKYVWRRVYVCLSIIQ